MKNNAAFEEEVKKHFLFLVTDYGVAESQPLPFLLFTDSQIFR